MMNALVWWVVPTAFVQALSSRAGGDSSESSDVMGVVWMSRRPSWAPRPYSPYGLCGPEILAILSSCGHKATSELVSSVAVEAAVLGSPSLTVPTVSVDPRY